MFPSVKKTSCVFILISQLNWAAPSLAAEQHYIYSEPHLPIQLQAILYQQSQTHPLWKLPLKPEQNLILRIRDYHVGENNVFYWTRTRLDNRSVALSLNLSLEIWQGQQLLWQDTTQVQRILRLMGPELRGTGQATVVNLAAVPEGVLAAIGLQTEQEKQIQADLCDQALHKLLVNYLKHNHES